MKKAKTKILRCVSGAVVGVMLISSLAGCGKNKQTGKEGGGEISCWMPLTSNMALYTSNYGETELAKELEKRTGVRLTTFIRPRDRKAKNSAYLLHRPTFPILSNITGLHIPAVRQRQ